jgi:hypothetical protein
MPKIKTDAINTNKIIDTNMRVLRENCFNKSDTFRSKLANIAPKLDKELSYRQMSNTNLL